MGTTTLVDLTGQKFGRLTVVELAPDRASNGGAIWLCDCACGTVKKPVSSSSLQKKQVSCGCVRKPHGEGGEKRTPEYLAWQNMKQRCGNSKFKAYKDYGGRGITVCPEWLGSFSTFLRDVGRRPSTLHSMDRIDNELGYLPGNCKWSTRSEQQRNRRNTYRLTLNGVEKSVADWAEEKSIHPRTLAARVFDYGWSAERALNEPPRHPNRWKQTAPQRVPTEIALV